jgi:hypothetical protein
LGIRHQRVKVYSSGCVISNNLLTTPTAPFGRFYPRTSRASSSSSQLRPPLEQSPAPHTGIPVTVSSYATDTPLSYLRVSDVGHIQTLVASVALVPCSAKWYLRIRHSIASFRLRLIGNLHSGPLCDTPCPTDLNPDLTTTTSGVKSPMAYDKSFHRISTKYRHRRARWINM